MVQTCAPLSSDKSAAKCRYNSPLHLGRKTNRPITSWLPPVRYVNLFDQYIPYWAQQSAIHLNYGV